jgi:glycerophosphoryl diester phosphodiesterase
MYESPVVIGHRGSGRTAPAGLPENTIASFEAALAAGATWVETDVRSCADGLVITHHPATADGRFYVDLTLDECRRLGLIAIDELIEWLPDGVGLDLEIKTSLQDARRSYAATTAAGVARYADRTAGNGPLLVSSFDPSALLIVREVAPGVPIGLLGWVGFPLRKLVPAGVHLGCAAVVASTLAFGDNPLDGTPRQPDVRVAVDVAHEAGLDVITWCPEADEVVQLAELGVDGVIVDDVPGTVGALAAFAG